MSSPPKENSELKAGHAAAVKAGGMRITQHKHPEKPEKPDAAENEEFPDEQGVTKSEKHNQSILISGAVTQGDKDFTSEAVKCYHEKPIPSKDKRPAQVSHNIKQPGGRH